MKWLLFLLVTHAASDLNMALPFPESYDTLEACQDYIKNSTTLGGEQVDVADWLHHQYNIPLWDIMTEPRCVPDPKGIIE